MQSFQLVEGVRRSAGWPRAVGNRAYMYRVCIMYVCVCACIYGVGVGVGSRIYGDGTGMIPTGTGWLGVEGIRGTGSARVGGKPEERGSGKERPSPSPRAVSRQFAPLIIKAWICIKNTWDRQTLILIQTVCYLGYLGCDNIETCALDSEPRWGAWRTRRAVSNNGD